MLEKAANEYKGTYIYMDKKRKPRVIMIKRLHGYYDYNNNRRSSQDKNVIIMP